MAYGETIFSIIYLLFVITSGIVLVVKSKKNMVITLMGVAALVLGIGDSFHLIPRCLSYFINADFNAAIGIGKLITSLTMTQFYIVILLILKEIGEKPSKVECYIIYALTACRIVLCAMPQNEWLTDSSPYIWQIVRNIPFALMGCMMVKLLFEAKDKYNFKYLWLLVLLSFVFYTIVIVGVPYVDKLGLFMIPKTICYILIILIFDLGYKEIVKRKTRKK